jgi:hypothetical protein
MNTTRINTMRDPDFMDEQRNADYLDAMADMEEEKRAAAAEYFADHPEDEEAMQSTAPSDWWSGPEISREEELACEYYNERCSTPFDYH